MFDIKKLTLKQKIGQLCQGVLSTATEEDITALVKEGRLGSCILADNSLAGNSKQRKASPELVNRVQKAAMENGGIPLMFARDVIHGMKIIYPIPLGLAASWDTALIKETAEAMSEEAFENGINLVFAPMLDLVRDPRWGRVIESPGEDPYLGAKFAKAMVEGIQGENLAAAGNTATCLKHFVGYGAAEGGRDYNKSEISDYTLYNMYLPAFMAGIDCGAASVMNSFGEIGGESVSASERILRLLLKEKLGFEGFVNSDWGSVEQIMDRQRAETRAESAYLALKAGIDIEMATKCYDENLEELVSKNPELEKYIDEAVSRILRIKERLGLFGKPYAEIVQPDEIENRRKKRRALSLRAAAESAVLLKNNGVLPLDADSRVIVTGPFAEEVNSIMGAWAPDGLTDEVATFRAAMENEFENSVFVSDNLREAMYVKERNCDTVILALGEQRAVTGERAVVGEIEISKAQTDIAKRYKELGKKVICVVFAGRPLSLTKLLPYSDAILFMWHPGTMGAAAAAKLLSGEFNPCGKLSMTMVASTGQIPLYYNTPPLPIRCDENDVGYYGEPYFPSYSDIPSVPLFPFGYGLSYTGFEYSDLSCDVSEIKLNDLKNGAYFTVRINVKNTGSRAGKEVVQCYICDRVSVYSRPIRELKGFEKTELMPGESKEISFKLGFDELGYYYPDGEKTVEPGNFRVFVGGSSYADNETEIIIK